MARRVTKNHYIAARGVASDSPVPVHINRNGLSNRGYSTDGEDSQRAPSDRTVSEYTSVPYTVVNERLAPPSGVARKTRSRNGGSRAPSAMSHSRSSAFGDNHSDIYVTSAAYKAPSEISRGSRYSRHAPSHYSYRSGVAPSHASTTKSRTSRKAGMRIETMSAPNPLCPNIKGMCCLMLLLNLGLILVTLGFVIVIQFFEPLFVWVLGIVFLIFGFLTLIGSLIYCVVVCRETQPRRADEDLYWTHRWHKDIGTTPHPDHMRYAMESDRYSDKYSVGKYSDSQRRY